MGTDNQNDKSGSKRGHGSAFGELWSGMPIIILMALIGALIAFLLSSTVLRKTYESTTRMYVYLKGENAETAALTGENEGTVLSGDYAEIAGSRDVAESVIAQLSLTDDSGNLMSYDKFESMLSVVIPEGTRLMEITVTTDDPYDACDIANAVREATAAQLLAMTDAESISVVDSADIPLRSSGPNSVMNCLIGALAGFVLAVIWILISFFRDDTIYTAADIEKYLGISTLGIIPLDANEKKSKKKVRKSR